MIPEITKDSLYKKIKVLNETSWEHRANRPNIDQWLKNFSEGDEQLHALYLLSHFMYFGSLQMRELLKSLYRDLYKHPIIEIIRQSNSNTVDQNFIETEFRTAESNSRFLGIGNPSESGTHLLYFFRQENKLRKNLFINAHEIFERDTAGTEKLAHPHIRHYVFIDDFCGSGSQASRYSKNVVKRIKKLDPSIIASYLMLFSTKEGKNVVKTSTLFDNVEAVVELDRSFKCFENESRYFNEGDPVLNKEFAKAMCENYGTKLMENMYREMGVVDPELDQFINRDKLGYENSQLLLGFHHNTPNNTLPIIWFDENSSLWYPSFRRYNKIYGI